MRSISRNLAAALVSVLAIASANAQPRTDVDPLPAGAITRFGSARFAHGHRLTGLSLSPDGAVMLAADFKRIVLWDTSSGRELRECIGLDYVHYASLSPDGKRVAAIYGGTVCIWDATTGKEQRRFVSKDGRSTTMCAWSGDGQWISFYADDQIHLWDLKSDKLLHRFDHKDDIRRIAISPDGKLLVSGKEGDNFQIIWDIGTEKELRRMPGGGDTYPWDFRFAPDGKSMIGGCHERKGNSGQLHLRRWDVETGKKLRDYERAYASFAGIAPDGRTIVCSDNTGIRVCDTESGKVLREWAMNPFSDRLALSADGKLLAAEVSGRVELWNPATGKPVRPPGGHGGYVRSVSFTDDGKSVVSGSVDNTVRVWDWTTGRETKRHRWSMAIFNSNWQHRPDGSVACIDYHNSLIRIWNPADDRKEKEVPVDKSTHCFVLDPDGQTFLTIKVADERISVFTFPPKGEPRRLEPLSKVVAEPGLAPNEIRSIALSENGRSVAFTDVRNNLGVTDTATGQRTVFFEDEDGKRPRIEHLLFSPDGKTVAMQNGTGGFDIRSASTGRRVSVLDKVNGRALAYSPDGQYLAFAFSGGNFHAITIWDVAAKKVLTRFFGHRGHVNAGAFEPRGRVFASASADGTLLVWDLTGVLADGRLPKKALGERELAAAWDELKSGEPPVAHKAVVALACGGADAIEFLGKQLASVPVVDPKRLDALVVELGDRDFRTREAAGRSLAALGDTAEPALIHALENGSLEVRTRAEALLITLSKPDASAEGARAMRALAALEYAGGPEAARLLVRYAAGDPGARLTRQAKAALARQEQVK